MFKVVVFFFSGIIGLFKRYFMAGRRVGVGLALGWLTGVRGSREYVVREGRMGGVFWGRF